MVDAHAAAKSAASVPADVLASAIDRLTFGAAAFEAAYGTPAALGPARFERILCCLDGSDKDADATAWSASMARLTGAHVFPTMVVEPLTLSTGYYPEGASDEDRGRFAQEATARAAEAVRKGGGAAEPVTRRGFIVPQLLAAAKDKGADLIVLGAHKASGLERLLLGSTSDGVKNHAECSVLLVKGAAPPKSVLAAVDGSSASRHAAAVALALAQSLEVPIRILHVVRREPPGDGVQEAAALQKAAAWKGTGIAFAVRVGRAADVIADEAKGMDRPLVVVGNRGLSGLKSIVPGSVSGAVAHHAPASVLIVK